MKKKFGLIALFVVATIAFVLGFQRAASADDFATVGFGPSLNGTTNPKELAVGYEKTWSELSLYNHCGAIFEAELNGYCSVTVGVHIETPSGIFTRATVGPAYVMRISQPRISSHWNANIVVAVGVYQGRAFFDVEYGHLSNAGWVPPNLGDDHGLAQIGYRF
jgi:hypothetical protein